MCSSDLLPFIPLNGSPDSPAGQPIPKNAPGRPRVFHTIVHRTRASWTAILSPWGIEGNAAGKAFLIIVNAAQHRELCRRLPDREPTPCLNSDRDIAAALRPGWAAAGEAPLTNRHKRQRIGAQACPVFTRRWPRAAKLPP